MSILENKIHIFSVNDFQLKHCIVSEISSYNIISYCFSKKNKFLSILYDDYNMHLFNLTMDKGRENDICACGEEEVKKKASSSFLGGLFSSIKVNKLFIIISLHYRVLFMRMVISLSRNINFMVTYAKKT